MPVYHLMNAGQPVGPRSEDYQKIKELAEGLHITTGYQYEIEKREMVYTTSTIDEARREDRR